jgi:hypothetical protein
LSDVLDLLERKRVEQDLVKAWTYWHGGPGDLVEAAKALSAFLCASGSLALFDPDDPDDRVVLYAQLLLGALLDSELSIPLFGAQRSLPPHLSGTLLARYIDDYERSRVKGAGMAAGS